MSEKACIPGLQKEKKATTASCAPRTIDNRLRLHRDLALFTKIQSTLANVKNTLDFPYVLQIFIKNRYTLVNFFIWYLNLHTYLPIRFPHEFTVMYLILNMYLCRY